MALDELNEILRANGGVLATFNAVDFSSRPDQVERMYHIYARGHVALSDTKQYTDRILRWLSGANQGAFVGAVSGDYGHGKTSFQVHVWEECRRSKVVAVPPFSWSSVSDILDGVAAWVSYELRGGHSSAAARVRELHESYREKSLKELSVQIASGSGRNVDDVYATLMAAQSAGGEVDTQVTPERLLDYFADLTDCIKSAGCTGLLVLLDEPEVAAKKLGQNRVSQILFDIANGLIHRKGDFGVFVSMPERFLAHVQSQFSSLPARLGHRQCFPRLRDMYGSDFAGALWNRYVEEFSLGDLGNRIVSPETLQAIGQVGSSDRSDLAYGPRTVVSAFARMVYLYAERGVAYSPIDFVSDCCGGEILTSEYPGRIASVLGAPECQGMDLDFLKTLAAFPNGMTIEAARALGIDERLQNLGALRGLVYKRGTVYGLEGLKKSHSPSDDDELRHTLLDIASEFAPNRKTLDAALTSFAEHVVPIIFEQRQGQQILGFEPIVKFDKLGRSTYGAVFRGAFRQTQSEYPQRTIAVSIGSMEDDVRDIRTRVEGLGPIADVWLCLRVRWAKDSELPAERLRVDIGDPSERVAGKVELILDWADGMVDFPMLEEQVGREMMAPLALLFLLGQKSGRVLSREHEIEWSSYQEPLISRLLAMLFTDPQIQSEASALFDCPVTGDALSLIGVACKFVLSRRYPEYCTLIRQSQWQKTIDRYISVLSNSAIPARCKRGKEVWVAPGDSVARAFTLARMNLTGGAFSSFESLISIRPSGKDELQVEFRLHPFEQAIVDRITVDNPNPKAKFEGKECWYLPVKEAAPWMLNAGYGEDEIAAVYRIGEARGSFRIGSYRRQAVLYCTPLDLEQMRTNLSEKLADLEKEIEIFRQLPDYRTSLDVDRIRTDIAGIADEDQFDALSDCLNREFEIMHSRLTNCFTRINDGLSAVSDAATSLVNGLANAREVSLLQFEPRGSCGWASDLNLYIMANLARILRRLNDDLHAILASIGGLKAKYENVKMARWVEKAQLALEGFIDVTKYESRCADLKNQSSALVARLHDYEYWLQLLKRSDEVLSSISNLKKESAHSGYADSLQDELVKLWGKISQHIALRNIEGLGSYKQFFDELNALDDRRARYLQTQRAAFDSTKRSVNDLLQASGLSIDARCTEVYNPDDVAGCYRRLYEGAAKLMLEALEHGRQALAEQRIELLYCRDILALAEAETCNPLLENLARSIESLNELSSSIGPDWVTEAHEDPGAAGSPIKDGLEQSDSIVRAIRQTVHHAQTARIGELGSEASEMLKLVPEGARSTNLKDIILAMMSHGGESDQVLTAALRSLGELFRHGRIAIKVERSNR